MYTRLFVGMGIFTSVVAGLATLWFNLIVKERVAQSVERPSIMQGVKSILNNKPVLLLTLSQILSSFSVGGSKSDYFIEVLNFATLGFFIISVCSSCFHRFRPWSERVIDKAHSF